MHSLQAQNSATFGEVIPLGGTPSDLVLDQARQRLYLVSSPTGEVEVWDYNAKALIGSISVGNRPLAAAMSMDNAFLYVTNHDNSSLSVISLAGAMGTVINTVTLPAAPQGVEVGADGRVLICTDGSGTSSLANTLLLFDPTQPAGSQVTPIQFSPPPPTPGQLQGLPTSRIVTTFNGKLLRTPDGQYIVGVSAIQNSTQTAIYVYEVASATLLQSRIVLGQSSTLSMAPDGASFMAGYTHYDVATLNVIGQQNIANAPFAMTSSFTLNANVGGSVFSSDGTTLYSAFNTAANTTPAPAAQASTLLISDPQTLAIRLGINLPESILAKMVITADGNDAWALSASGVIHLPLGAMYSYPILMPDTTTVFLSQNSCNLAIPQATVQVNNIGGGALTFAVPSSISGGSAALVIQAKSGLAPSTVTFTMDPGRSGAVRTPGTNLYTGAGSSNTGAAVNVQLASSNAINVPPTIRVFMNYRDSSMRGLIYPIPTMPNSTAATTANPQAYAGLQDIVLDEARHRVYISNAGYNRIEVFDTQQLAFQTPITVGQLPRNMAMSLDGLTLYVANIGSETVTMVDLDTQKLVATIQFPPAPRNATTAPIYVQGLAMALSGLQILRSDGNLWEAIGQVAVPRTPTPVTGVSSTCAQSSPTCQTPINTPTIATLLAADDGSYGFLLAGNGTGYLYDGLQDAYLSSANGLVSSTIGYFGPLAIAPGGAFLVADGLVMNRGLAAIGGAASPGQAVLTPPTIPGQPFSINVTSNGLRNVAASATVDQTYFVRMSTPVRNSLTTTTSDDVHTILEVVDTATGASATAARMPENPVLSEFGATRTPMPRRQMVIDSQGTVYALTVSGLSVAAIAPATSSTQPQIATKSGVVNAGDGTTNIAPGSYITINGTHLASQASAADPHAPPTVLGGSCVLVDNVAIPLLATSPTQISAQLPSSTSAGPNVVEVRSLAMAQASSPIVVTLQKP